MAYSDPQSVTIATVAQSLPRVSSGENRSSYRKDDATVELLISHAYGKRNRRLIKLTHRKVATDPLVPTNNVPYEMNCSFILDTPKVGYTVAEAKQIGDALVAYLTASSGANITKLLGGES